MIRPQDDPPAPMNRNVSTARKVSVLLLEDDFLGPEGGTEQHLLFLQRELPCAFVDLHFAVLSSIRRMDADEFPLRPVMLNSCRHGRCGALRRLRRLAAFIKTNEIDVVHAFCRTSELFACLAVKLVGRGKVLGVRRNIGYWHTWRSRWWARMMGLLNAEYAANCQAAREFACKVEWIGRQRVSVIPNPAPTKRFEDAAGDIPSRSSLGIAADEQIVGMVGTVRPVKDYATFLRAARLTLDHRPRTRFLVVGAEDAAYKRQMLQLAATLRIERQLVWLGPMPNPLAIVPLFDVAVLSSESEAMSNAILEYMVAGVPTVATAVGGTPEILQNGRTGYLVPSKDPDAMAERVCALLDDPALRRMFAAAARQKVETAFAVPRVIRAYRDLYFQLAGKGDAVADLSAAASHDLSQAASSDPLVTR
jgi:glycosyltransferase involved in cell wall biosynthesis